MRPTSDAPETRYAGGRSLSLVAALADHWETLPYPPIGKTIRAELAAPTRE